MMQFANRWIALFAVFALVLGTAPAAFAQQAPPGGNQPSTPPGQQQTQPTGQTGDNQGTATGQQPSDRTSGQSGTAQGQTTAPGQAGTTPGQTGETPGQTGAPPPGQTGTTPGQSGTTPGQSGTAPERSDNQGQPPAGQAGDNQAGGNRGTIKVSTDPLFPPPGSSRANEPQIGDPCEYYIIGFGFPTDSGTFTIHPQPDGGQGPAGTSSAEGSYGPDVTDPYPVVVEESSQGNGNQSLFDFQIGPITDFEEGQYKIEVNSADTPGGAKQKVFRLGCSEEGGTTTERTEEDEETVDVEKTVDTDVVGAAHFAGKRLTYNILITRKGQMPTATVRALDVLGDACPGFVVPEEVTTDNVGFTTTIDGCTVRIQGDAKADVGNLVHLKVRVVPQADGASIPSSVTNGVTAEVDVPGNPRDVDRVTTPVTPPAGDSSQPQASTTETVGQAQVAVAGIQAGRQVTVPRGVPMVIVAAQAAVPGPAVVMVENQPVTIPANEVLVLGVMASRAAPATGISGLGATGYVYTIEPGETLESIATWYYGDAAYAWDLYQANAEILEGMATVVPGTVLVLP